MVLSNDERNLLKLVFFSFCSYFVVYYLDSYIASLLGTFEYKNFMWAVRSLFMLVFIISLGQDGLIFLFFNNSSNRFEKTKFISWLNFTVMIRLIIAIILAFFLVVVSGDIRLHLAYVILYSPWVLSLFFIEKLLLVNKKFDFAYLAKNFLQPLLFYICINFFNSPSSLVFFNIYGCCFILSVIILCFFLKNELFTVLSYDLALDKKDWYLYSWYYWNSVIVSQIANSTNFFILNLFKTSDEDIMSFSAVLTISLIFTFISKPFDYYLRPWISLDNKNKIFEVLYLSNLWKFIIIMMAWVVIIIFSEHFLLRYGSNCIKHVNLLRFFITVQFIFCMLQSNLDLLNLTNYAKNVAILMRYKLLISNLLNILLVPFFGFYSCLLIECFLNLLLVSVAIWLCMVNLGFCSCFFKIVDKYTILK